MHAVPAFSYISTNTEFNPTITDLRHVLKHQPLPNPDIFEKQNNLHKQQQNHQRNAIVLGKTSVPNSQNPKDDKNRKQIKKEKKDKNNRKEKRDKYLNNSAPSSPLLEANNIPLVAMKRNVQHHEYYNIIEEQKNIKNEIQNHPQFRRFGDTNLLKRNKKNLNMNNETQMRNDRHPKNGNNITSFAALESKNLDALLDETTINRYSNLSLASKFLNFDIQSPKRKNSLESPSSTSSNSNSSKNSSLLSSLDIIEQSIINHHGATVDSHLGPFNFRQLLRPTQGPTESLRKRKGINPPSPPPPQRGKSYL